MSCFDIRIPSIVIGLAVTTVTLATTADADAQRRGRAGTTAREEPAAVDPPAGEVDPRLDEEGRQLFLAGEAAYDAGRYEAALDYFERAYALTGRPALLFNIGSVTERLRRDDEALRSYERYLEAMPDAPNRAFVESRIEFLREQVAADWREREAREASSAEEGAATPRPPVDEEIARDDDRERTDVETLPSPLAAGMIDPQDDRGGGDITQEWWFWTLIGVAVVGAGVGIGVAVASSDSGTPSPPVTGDFGPGGVIVALESW